MTKIQITKLKIYNRYLFTTFFTFVLFFSAFSYVNAATYYISPQGNDSNPGTEAQPFRNIQKAADIVDPGDTVIVKDGTYIDDDGNNFVVVLNNGGTLGNPITFKSENKWGAVLDGQNYTTSYGWGFSANANYVRIEDFEIKGFSRDGATSNAGAQNGYYYRNHIHHIGNYCTDGGNGLDGIYQGATSNNFTYDSNVIHNIGRLHPGEQGCSPQSVNWTNHDHGLYLHGNNNLVENNIFYDNDSGWHIQILGGDNYKIVNNTFINPSGGWPEGGTTGHILAFDMTNSLIANNISYNPVTSFIYHWVQNSSSELKNNLVYDRISGSIFSTKSYTKIIKKTTKAEIFSMFFSFILKPVNLPPKFSY